MPCRYTSEVSDAQKTGCSLFNSFQIESRVFQMVCPTQERRGDLSVQDAVPVFPKCSIEPGVEFERYIESTDYADRFREVIVKGCNKGYGAQFAASGEINHLTGRVGAGIGAARSPDPASNTSRFAHGSFQVVLYGRRTHLKLKSGVIRPVIFNH